MRKEKSFDSWFTKGSQIGGVPRIYYGWMAPGTLSRRRFEKHRNPFVDLETGTSLYYRDMRDGVEAMRREAGAAGSVKGPDNSIDLYNEYKIVPDLYPEGFQWKHKLNSEYNQWRSNTWVTPDLIPQEHRGRFLCNFQLNIADYQMKVAKFSPKDHRQWIFCLLYIGSGKGLAGWGRAVAPSSMDAKKEAIKVAFQNMIGINLENEGPIYPININHNGTRVLLYPSKRISANFLGADILCAFGINGAGIRINFHHAHAPKSRQRVVGGIFEAISMMRTATEIAHMRGKIASSLVYNIFPFLEEVRRRKGMMAMTPLGKDGMFAANRVVDNRMPDHLKHAYYDDAKWKDFFAGSRDFLNEPRLGLRGDQLRALLPANQSSLIPAATSAVEPPLAAAVGSTRVADSKKGGGGAKATRGPLRTAAQSTSGGRRTLADVLQRMNRGVHSLGALPVANPHVDKKLTGHAKDLFHLHPGRY